MFTPSMSIELQIFIKTFVQKFILLSLLLWYARQKEHWKMAVFSRDDPTYDAEAQQALKAQNF